jgi:lipoate---protein ligase
VIRLLRTGVAGAAENVAFTMALAQLRSAGQIPDTLRLYGYRRCVLLGRSQGLDAIDAVSCAMRDVDIARRMTGGGAVYMAPGVLAWDLVVSRQRFSSLDDASRKICNAVAACLSGLGFPARFVPPGDVRVGDSKLSGSAGWFEDDCLIHQGTLLIDADLAEMSEVLGFDPSALPVTTLALQSGNSIGSDTVNCALEAALTARLGPIEPGEVTHAETGVAQRILDGQEWLDPRHDEMGVPA